MAYRFFKIQINNCVCIVINNCVCIVYRVIQINNCVCIEKRPAFTLFIRNFFMLCYIVHNFRYQRLNYKGQLSEDRIMIQAEHIEMFALVGGSQLTNNAKNAPLTMQIIEMRSACIVVWFSASCPL